MLIELALVSGRAAWSWDPEAEAGLTLCRERTRPESPLRARSRWGRARACGGKVEAAPPL